MRAEVSNATRLSAVDIASGQILSFVVTAILARLLTPADFGIVAISAIFVAIAGVFVDCGLSSALIQRKEIDKKDCSTVFWFSLGVSLVAALILILIGPFLAASFEKPVLIPVMYVLALGVVANSLASVPRALFVKRLEFLPLLIINVISWVVSATVAIVLAYQGYGVFALAWHGVISSILGAVFVYIISPWRPSFLFSHDSVKKLFGFGGYLLASTLIEVIYNKIYILFLGKFYGAETLGLFARAESTSTVPTALLTATLSRVSLPAFSKISHDHAKVREGMYLTLKVVIFVSALVMLGLASVAGPFMITLYGPQWEPAVPLLQILCLAGVLLPLNVLNAAVLMALGRSDIFFRNEVIKKIIGIGILMFTFQYGPIAIAWGMVAYSVVTAVVNSYPIKQILGYGIVEQMIDIMPNIAFASATAVGAGFGVWFFSAYSPILQLFIGIGAGGILAAVLALLFKPEGFVQLRRVVLEKF